MDKTTDKFVTYVSDLSYSDLTPAAIHAVKRSVVDSIGCAFGAFHAAPLKAIRNLAAQVTALRPATVIGTQVKTSPELAALANGAMVRYLDFSDDYFGGSGDIGPHPSDNIFGVLAATETTGADGKSFILGTAIAYEACGQIVDQINLRGVKRSWDYPVLHSIGTSLGAGKIMGLSREQMRDALALAVVPNICLNQTRNGQLSNWKGFAGPNGSRNGLFAALLAREGVTGPAEPFEGKAGLMKHLNNPFELGVLGGKGVPFKIEGTFYKCMPVRYTVQLPVWIALELRKKVRIADIEAVCVYVVKRYVISKSDYPEYWDPTTRETADHSAVYLIGAAFVDGEITARTFTAERYRDPAILALIQKIHMEEDKEFSAVFPRTFNCRFKVTLKSGDVIVLHKTNPKGHPANPMSDQEIEEKFLKQADTALLPPKQSRNLLDRLWELEKLDDIKKLFALMLVPNS